MATSTYLSNLSELTVNSVSLVDQCTGIVFTQLREALDKTTLADTGRTYTGGLYNNECTMTLFQSYAASETYATLASIVGTQTTVVATVVEGAVTKVFTLGQLLPGINASYQWGLGRIKHRRFDLYRWRAKRQLITAITWPDTRRQSETEIKSNTNTRRRTNHYHNKPALHCRVGKARESQSV
jgi:hypothetical protein